MEDRQKNWTRADEDARKALPLGVALVHTLRGHTETVGRIAWSSDGRLLASPSADETIRIWDIKTGKCAQTLKGHRDEVTSVAFDPARRLLASGSHDKTLKLWDLDSGAVVRTLSHSGAILSVTFDRKGHYLVGGSWDGEIKLWEMPSCNLLSTFAGGARGNMKDFCLAVDALGRSLACTDGNEIGLWNLTNSKLLRKLVGHQGPVLSVAFDLANGSLASTSADKTVKLWNPDSGKLLRTLEGHTASAVSSVDFSRDGRVVASKGGDNTIRLWNNETGSFLALLPEMSTKRWVSSLAFNPRRPLLATVGSDPGTPEQKPGFVILRDRVIHIWELDLDFLFSQVNEPSVHYVNAKVVLVGDTGVGKSGLSLVLNNQPFEPTDSTPGRRVWTLDSEEVQVSTNVTQTRETLLWDLAGQPGYRIIHQLHLSEVAVALIVFDARSETDPLAGVRHWERALRLARQRQGSSGIPMKKYLVSARNDRGGVSLGDERLQAILKEFGFDGYFKTSAKEGWQITELREAVRQAIIWSDLPEVSSSQLFADLKSFLLEVKKTGQLLSPVRQLHDDFANQNRETTTKVTNLNDQFDTCIGRLENRDLIRRLSFGGYVLLQPELLDAYASAMVNMAKEEPDGLGSLAEEIALTGKFFVPPEQKIKDVGQEQLLLHATVEELVRHDLALRENADDGRHLVFPSQFNRDYEDAPEPRGKSVSISFDGPVQSLYSTLAVRLAHSGLFTTGRADMWRNAAIFTAKAGGKCGLFLSEFAEGRGRLILFYSEDASNETRFHFEEFVLAHAERRALDGTIDMIRFFICDGCGEPVPNAYVKIRRSQGAVTFNCPCGGEVSLVEPKERLRFSSALDTMNSHANRYRDFDAFVMSARGETSTTNFLAWAGGERVTLAIVFTDIVGSTALGEEKRDEFMSEIRRSHFAQSRSLIKQFKGREIKTIGDSFMAAFRSVDAALNYAILLHKDSGNPNVKIRAGIHIGPMHVEESDVFGGTVNFAARVVGAIRGAEIWISDRAKEDIDRLGSTQHKHLEWKLHEDVIMKGFPGSFALWSMVRPDENL